ncbi:hypothetical protein ASF10_20410 [Flavobacterium sp. Leaf82]|uniref:hypothetical protein n=1 Tax=unclassified Flavobacterium TaxID=196869 RepID=UPI0006F6519B|nr:hypothetical protein [Flavobacterium sp. Leaf82]KQO32818.1 hypothetical protein ASF10_20410 [Flavobacterium sp. Leaf82]
MRNQILIPALLFCFISCNKGADKTNLKTEKAQIIKKTVFIDEMGDTIKSYSFDLKKNYKLIIFPAIDNNKEIINFRLINGKRDNTYLLVDTFQANYMRHFNKIDFTNYFALQGNGGGTSHFYFWLYDKESGNEVLRGIERDFDLKKELILYVDEDDEYKTFIYDVNTKIKTLVDIPLKFLNRQECTKYNDSEKTLYIKRVTSKYYYLGFKCCEPLSVQFRIKKAK